MNRAITVIAIATVMLCTVSVDAADPRQTAQRLFREGRELYDSGKYTAALRKFKKARKHFPSYKIDLSIGYTLEAMGRNTDAAVHYERFLLRKTENNERVAAEVFGKLKQLRKKLAMVTVSTEIRGAVVEVDGKVLANTPHHGRLYLSPGQHRLRVSTSTGEIYAKEINLRPGSHFVARVKDTQAKRQTAWIPTTAPDKQQAPKPFYKKWWFWTAIGAAVVGTTVGIAVGAGDRDERLPHGDSGTVVMFE